MWDCNQKIINVIPYAFVCQKRKKPECGIATIQFININRNNVKSEEEKARVWDCNTVCPSVVLWYAVTSEEEKARVWDCNHGLVAGGYTAPNVRRGKSPSVGLQLSTISSSTVKIRVRRGKSPSVGLQRHALSFANLLLERQKRKKPECGIATCKATTCSTACMVVRRGKSPSVGLQLDDGTFRKPDYLKVRRGKSPSVGLQLSFRWFAIRS